MKKLNIKKLNVFAVLILVFALSIVGCNSQSNQTQTNAEEKSSEFEPETEKYKYKLENYVKEIYRSMDISYPVFLKPKKSVGEISLTLTECDDLYIKRDIDNEVYYVVKELEFSPFYDDSINKGDYSVTDNGNPFVDDEELKSMYNFNMQLYNTTGYLKLDGADSHNIEQNNDSFISESIDIKPDEQNRLRYVIVMEFDTAGDSEENYRQSQETEKLKICELLNRAIVNIDAWWKYEGYEGYKFHQENYYKISTGSNISFDNIKLTNLTSGSGGYAN